MASTFWSHRLSEWITRYRARHGGRAPSARRILLMLAHWWETYTPPPDYVRPDCVPTPAENAAKLRAQAEAVDAEERDYWRRWCGGYLQARQP